MTSQSQGLRCESSWASTCSGQAAFGTVEVLMAFLPTEPTDPPGADRSMDQATSGLEALARPRARPGGLGELRRYRLPNPVPFLRRVVPGVGCHGRCGSRRPTPGGVTHPDRQAWRSPHLAFACVGSPMTTARVCVGARSEDDHARGEEVHDQGEEILDHGGQGAGAVRGVLAESMDQRRQGHRDEGRE